MKYKMLNKNKVDKFLGEVGQKCAIWGPKKEADKVKFGKVGNTEEMYLNGYMNTTMSPKNLFFPQSETMLSFNKSGEDANIYREVDGKPSDKAVFGIRPCDAAAFVLLDKIFKNDQFTDTYWFEKRGATTLIGLGCNEPCSSCFCTSVNSHPFDEKGLDVLASDLGDRYLLKILTEKGERLLEGIASLDDANDADVSGQKALSEKAAASITTSLNHDRIREKSILELFNADCWSRIYESCLNCGTCTFVCPTCHCFDIQDEIFKDGGVRIRNWDTCMSWLFTIHATGHNPRPSKKERVRQRFMHKFKYIPIKRDGDIGCVGCGRCVNLCPVNIDVREVVQEMNALK